eukprot:CAMPEP_0202372936 /NCGR_PEP_ID=MMETSP1127-20130417/4048_1 /ASSEMBLY_ACC=CAM_ASM_000462 /TAXON_ID=3047 /ORGANISM="Dunaliella tertiolecta, Strain CCMP1320" /LENGTH=604 /DNA_ID=CAMNT_0048969649 /DNA_START=241 /DNA_END=2054 /DNA_ORIENTATION=+
MAGNWAPLQVMIATLLVIVLGVFILRVWKRSAVNVPGPKGWPWFGPRTPEDLGAMVQLANKLGKIFKLTSGFRTTVVVCDPFVAAAVLEDEQAFLPKPSHPQRCVNEMLHPCAHPCLLTQTHADKVWRSMRRCMAKSFTAAEIREDFEVAKDKALAMVELFSGLKPGSAIDMAVMASSFSIDLFGLAKLGYDFESVEGGGNVPVASLLSSCQEELALRKLNPWRRWGWLVSDGLSDATIKYSVLHAFMGQIWQTIRARGMPPEDNHTLAAQLMRLWKTGTVTDSMIQSELAGMLFAGQEALAQSLAWATQLLAANPDAQEKLHQELAQAGFVAQPANLTFDTVGSLKYLDAVVREVLRLHPTYGNMLTREASKDVVLGKIKVPQGCHVCVHPYAMHRCSRFWLHPTAFKPERWQCGAETKGGSSAAYKGLPGGSQRHNGMATWPDVQQAHIAMMGANDQQGPATQPINAAKCAGGSEGKGSSGGNIRKRKGDKAPVERQQENQQEQEEGMDAGEEGPQLCASHAFMPFGLGPRSCVGQVFAQAALKAALSILIAFYKLELAGTSKTPAGPEDELLLPLRFKLRGVLLTMPSRKHQLQVVAVLEG